MTSRFKGDEMQSNRRESVDGDEPTFYAYQRFQLDVTLESASGQIVASIPMRVSPTMTIYALKVKMTILHGIPMECQRWIIGKKIPNDKDSLKPLGITGASRVFLYVVGPTVLKLNKIEVLREIEYLKKFYESHLERGVNPDLMTEDKFEKYLTDMGVAKVVVRKPPTRLEIIDQLRREGYETDDCREAVNESGADFQRAKSYFKDCDICYTSFTMSKIVVILYCQCHVCTECFTGHFTVLAKTNPCMYKYVCPVCQTPELRECKERYFQDYFGLLGTMLQQHLGKPDYDLYQSKLVNWGLMKEENFRWCANGCGSGFINDRIGQLKLQCPNCRKYQCFECKKTWLDQHDKISCEEFDSWKRNNDPEFQQLGLAAHLKENGINCPKCKMRYELAKGGCMHFKCPQCQHEFCCGCNLPFRKYPECNIFPTCEGKGIHAHHPRDCLYHLRDLDCEMLQKMLQNCGINFNRLDTGTKRDRGAPATCSVNLQMEIKDGLADNKCGKPMKGQSGLCELHYKEYLVSLMNRNKVDPVDIFNVEEMGRVLARHNKPIPEKERNEKVQAYQKRLRQFVKDMLPLK